MTEAPTGQTELQVKRDRTAFQVVLVFIGSLFQLPFLYFFLVYTNAQLLLITSNPNVTNSPAFIPIPFYAGSWTITLVIYLVYFILTILYCGAIAYFTNPKRIVSALQIQLLASVFSSIILGAYYAYHTYSTADTSLTILQYWFQNYLVLMLLGLAVAFIIGSIQTEIIRRLAGLSPKSEPERLSFTVDAPLKDVVRTLKNRDFQNNWSTRLVKEPGGVYFMRMNYSTGQTTIVTIGSDPAYPADTILASVAFETSRYELFKSREASEQRRSVVNDIEGRLREFVSPEVRLTKREPDDFVSSRALSYATHKVQSSLAGFTPILGQIPRYHILVVGAVVLGIIALTVIHFYVSTFDVSTYIVTVAGFFLALVVDIGLAIRQELKESGGGEAEV